MSAAGWFTKTRPGRRFAVAGHAGRRSELNWRGLGLVGATWLLLELGLIFGGITPPAMAASVTSPPSWSGGYTNGGPTYAKSGTALTLGVQTSSDTRCVILSGAHTAQQHNPNKGLSEWTFKLTAGATEGVKAVMVTAYPEATKSGTCSGATGTYETSYIVDNTGPLVTAALTPAANAAGWNNSDVSIAWSATDAGSGVKAGTLLPASDSVTTNTSGVSKTATAKDNLDTSGSGSVTVKVDKDAPSITGSRSPAAGNGAGWNNTDVTVGFSCADATGTGIVTSGIKACPTSKVVSSDGANQSVTGDAVDVADNKASSTVGSINVDKTAPTLAGAPTTDANGNGWYNGNVTIRWTCSDATSGIAGACPDDSTLAGEGSDLTSSASVSDKAGNAKTAASPAVSIDRKAPVTAATASGGEWNNVDVAVTLEGDDVLSGVDATRYTVNGGAVQTYDAQNKPSFSRTGVHTLEFWSVDKAGNTETRKSIEVKIDKTPPTIGHALDPAANRAGWHQNDVTVTFKCEDGGGSGIKSCTAPARETREGTALRVTGTAEDNAGNTASDPVDLNIDRTAPTIKAAADRAPNDNGWYAADVRVSFLCGDGLAGVASCPTPITVGEGADQEAGGTASDAAGNTAGDKITGIDVDKTPPTLTGEATSKPNGNGWYNGDVAVKWTCADQAGLSGLAGACPEAGKIEGEGDSLSASASVSDRAGNSTDTTVGGLKIDRNPPSTSAAVAAPLESGWYAGAVDVTLDGVDPLSGVDKIYYQVDTGPAQLYTGKFSHSLGGTHTITFWSVDKAGNTEDKTAPGHALTLKIDDVKPSITGSRTPDANGFGWNNGPVTVSFKCDDAESGIAGCVGSQEIATETIADGVFVEGNARDNAGNIDDAKVGPIKIDLTKPTLRGAATTAPNAADWYKGDVEIKWTGEDGLSRIDPATVPADSKITGEGRNLGAGPVSVSDKAGNSESASVSGIMIDRTAPTITPVLPAKPASGWYSSDVTVEYTCADSALKDGSAGSGVGSCPTEKVLFSNGANQSTTSATAADNAGNVAPGATVGGINVDGLAPQSKANNQCDGKNGWCKGQTATVVIDAADQTGLSGVKEIRYSVNGGSEKTAAGASTSVNVPLAAKSGVANVVFYAVDNAGNVEAANGVALRYDNIAPTVTHSLTPAANAADWNNATAVVKFSAEDDDGGSGVDAATVTKDVTVSEETPGQKVDGSADDMAGNRGTDSVTVKLDRTAPTITGAATTASNAAGWYSSAVKVQFTCDDKLSGFAICPEPVTLTADGADQSVTRSAKDHADNEASATVKGINIDGAKPTVEVTGVSSGAIYTLGSVPAGDCKAADVGPSGLDANGCKFTVTGGQANGVGTFNYTATARDVAGNVTTVTGSYTVRYPIVLYSTTFWLQPINDTAHTTGSTTSVFKAGSTVPAKFRLVGKDGKAIQANTPPQWMTPAKGSATTAQVDESVYTEPATSGSAFTWNAAEQHYQFNWSSPKNGNGWFWRIGVKLDDGTFQAVNIGLR